MSDTDLLRIVQNLQTRLSYLETNESPPYLKGTWVPTWNLLTVVNGTGGATYTGRWTLIGKLVHYRIAIAVTGSCTTASTAGTTSCNNLPFSIAYSAPCIATNAAVANYGTGLAGSTSVYTPSWAAYNGAVYIDGWGEIA